MHLTPAGFPFGIPGIGLVIDGAVQQAPQSGRQLKTLVIRQFFRWREKTGAILPGSAEITAFMVQKSLAATNWRPNRPAGLTLAGWTLTLRMPGNVAIAQAQHSAANTDHVVTAASPGMLKSIRFIAGAYASYVAPVFDYLNAAGRLSFDKMTVFLI